jgi:CheY-like chemotaxis protein
MPLGQEGLDIMGVSPDRGGAKLATRLDLTTDAPEPAPRRLRVLLVDDEPLVARAVARVLREHEVDVETSAAGALARLRAGVRYDAVVCDLMMPDATGMELHARVAEADAGAAARFVFLTGGAFTDGACEFVATTSAPVLEKPLDAATLKDAVRAVSGERQDARPARVGGPV